MQVENVLRSIEMKRSGRTRAGSMTDTTIFSGLDDIPRRPFLNTTSPNIY